MSDYELHLSKWMQRQLKQPDCTFTEEEVRKDTKEVFDLLLEEILPSLIPGLDSDELNDALRKFRSALGIAEQKTKPYTPKPTIDWDALQDAHTYPPSCLLEYVWIVGVIPNDVFRLFVTHTTEESHLFFTKKGMVDSVDSHAIRDACEWLKSAADEQFENFLTLLREGQWVDLDASSDALGGKTMLEWALSRWQEPSVTPIEKSGLRQIATALVKQGAAFPPQEREFLVSNGVAMGEIPAQIFNSEVAWEEWKNEDTPDEKKVTPENLSLTDMLLIRSIGKLPELFVDPRWEGKEALMEEKINLLRPSFQRALARERVAMLRRGTDPAARSLGPWAARVAEPPSPAMEAAL